MNILIILSLYIFCHITHPKVYWVRKQCFLFLMGLWLDWLIWAFLTWKFLCGCSPVAAGARGIWAGWMSAWFLSSWLASGLGCRERLGSSRASLPLFPIPSFLTPTLCFSKILPLEASLVAQRIKNLPAMWDTQVWPLGWEDLLEKGMATHSSVLAWEIVWINEPVGLQFMGLQQVGHDCATNTLIFLPHSFQVL